MTINTAKNDKEFRLYTYIVAYSLSLEMLKVFVIYSQILVPEQKDLFRSYVSELRQSSCNRRLHRFAEQSVEEEGIEEATRKSEEFLGKYYY